MILEGNSKTIGAKPANMHQFGISSSDRPGKARKYKCSGHRQELCGDCCLDLQAVNHLSNLRQLNQAPTQEQIEEIAELNFASLKMAESTEGTLGGDPIECMGLRNSDKRFVLKSLLKYVVKHPHRRSWSQSMASVVSVPEMNLWYALTQRSS
jgi:hypothetical protein